VALLVLDEQLTAKSLVDGLRPRGLEVKTVKDFGVTQRAIPTSCAQSEIVTTGIGCWSRWT
jgi:hypothetical protein